MRSLRRGRSWTVGLVGVVVAVACAGRERVGAGREASVRTLAVVRGSRIVVVHDPADESATLEIVAALPTALARAERWGPLPGATIFVHASDESFRQAVGPIERSGLRAWTRYDEVHLRAPRAWGPLGAAPGELVEVLGHELTHCVTYQRIGDLASWARRPLPFWFREGMALDVHDPDLDRAMRARLRTFEARRAPPGGESALARAQELLPDHADLAYATAHVAFDALVERAGRAVVGRILDRVRDDARFDDAFAAEAGLTLAAFDAEVRRAILAPR